MSSGATRSGVHGTIVCQASSPPVPSTSKDGSVAVPPAREFDVGSRRAARPRTITTPTTTRTKTFDPHPLRSQFIHCPSPAPAYSSVDMTAQFRVATLSIFEILPRRTWAAVDRAKPAHPRPMGTEGPSVSRGQRDVDL